MTMAAVLAMLASTHVAAATLTVRQCSCAGSPVAGSITWCSSTSPRRHRRTVVPEVATPPDVDRDALAGAVDAAA